MDAACARFRGESRIDRIRAGDVASFLRVGDGDSAVRALQGALIDHGLVIADGPTGFFGQQTADAVVQFKTVMGLTPNDPVAGVKTFASLDQLFALPDAERREWAERFGRDAEGPAPAMAARPLPEVNFSRFHEQTRRLDGRSFTLSPLGAMLPAPFRTAFFVGLAGLLDPAGSPNGPQTESGTWGASPFDLYHMHLAVDGAHAEHGGWSALREEYTGRIHNGARSLARIVDAGGMRSGSDAWTQRYRELVLGPVPGFDATLAQMTETWLEHLHAESMASGIELHFLWHTFESLSGRWRPDGMLSNSPRRSWWNVIAPTAGPIAQTPFTAGTSGGDWLDLGQLAFIVDQQAIVTVTAPNLMEVASLHGIAMDVIEAHDTAPHVH